ncbi:MAG: hydrogenase iron-sulfur subunit [Proteobacteria bacterium]|nr:hydrogenase iron-sulfur subunit [Pseudomonadota bacterium]
MNVTPHTQKPKQPVQEGFQPKILAFLCNWCAYAGADLAGISRFQYPPSIRVVRVMCSGRVDPVFIPEGLLSGFDGVMVLGCHPGDCHYLTGNVQAEKKMRLARQALEMAGIGTGRFMLDWVSAGEGQRFAEVVRNFTEALRDLGPLEITEAMRRKLLAVKATLEGEKLRWLVGKEEALVEGENVYGETVKPEQFRTLMESTLRDEYAKNRIILLLEVKPLSAEDIRSSLGLNVKELLVYLIDLIGAGRVTVAEGEGRVPTYVRSG